MKLALVLALVASGAPSFTFDSAANNRSGHLLSFVHGPIEIASLRYMFSEKDGGLGSHHAIELAGEPDGGWSFGCANDSPDGGIERLELHGYPDGRGGLTLRCEPKPECLIYVSGRGDKLECWHGLDTFVTPTPWFGAFPGLDAGFLFTPL